MAYPKYYIQPGDDQITFDFPLTLGEIKQLHRFAFEQVKSDAQQGVEIKSSIEMLSKLDALINYLQKEHYQNP